jgi:hypothetical protein
MPVGTTGGTTIERDEPPQRLPAGLLPQPPAVPARRAPSLAWALAVVAMIGICVLLIEWLAGALDPAGDRAMAEARQAAIAVEGFASDHGGRYDGATVEDLRLSDASVRERLELYTAPTSYVVAVDDGSGVTFVIRRDYEGNEWHTCTPAGEGACPATGRWH